MSPRTADAPGTWDRQAARYAAQEPLEARTLATVARLAAPGTEATVVDLGAGTGGVSRALAALPAPPAQVVGVDRSPGMLGAAPAGGLPPGWRVLQADARAVPLPDGAGDVVTCAYVLHLLGRDDRAAVLAEAARLLRPGGRLVVATVWTDGSRPGGRAAGAVLRGLAAVAPTRLGGLRPLDPTADLEHAGFAVLREVRLPRGGYPSLVLAAALGGSGTR